MSEAFLPFIIPPARFSFTHLGLALRPLLKIFPTPFSARGIGGWGSGISIVEMPAERHRKLFSSSLFFSVGFVRMSDPIPSFGLRNRRHFHV